uniref:relaxase domain-containing protein n=1 Tax=Escherichia coli TaxID=562 RepID=UPI0032C3E980
YTDKDNYYVLGSMGERWAGRGAEQLGLQGSVDKDVFTRLLEGKLPDGADVQQAVTQAIAGLSERKVQFTYPECSAAFLCECVYRSRVCNDYF